MASAAVAAVEAARAAPGIEGVTISMHQGQPIAPLPEGSAYLGFIFSRATTPAEAEASLRRAHALVESGRMRGKVVLEGF